ncbi:MAG TPA: hypothetical protein VLS89_03445 [Candidatus Nanopelagicales bacterium]|nr:hypothetical protein [Candidatus Nanopelagicales bacterium]
MRVAVIPTGEMELGGLAPALERLFPAHEFITIPKIPGRPGERAKPFDQSNTSRVSSEASKEGLKSDRRRLVEALAGAVYPSDRRDAADLALVLDDLELVNLDQPHVVVDSIRNSVRAHLDQQRARLSDHDVRDLKQCLRDRASFHLAAPMPESWLFADPNGPVNSGVRAEESIRLKQGIDPEQFETDDPAYSSDDGAKCSQLLDRNRRRGEDRRPPWVIKPNEKYPWCTRERHPKAYLQWLCRDPAENTCTRWQESRQGVEALRKLDWQAALAEPAWCTWLRALVEDLADGLGEPTPVPGVAGTTCPLTARKHKDQSAVLRNL